MTSETDPCPTCGASPVDRQWDLYARDHAAVTDHLGMTDSVSYALHAAAGGVHVSGSANIRTSGHVQRSAEAEISPPEVAEEVRERVTEIALGIRIQPHTDEAPGWYVELVNARGEVVGSGFGADESDTAMGIAIELERVLQGADEPPNPDADL